MSSVAQRLLVTIAIPVVLHIIGWWVLIPGASQVFGDPQGMSVLALGIGPILSAYWLVELVAMLVPRLNRLRHGNPAGRAKLDAAGRLVAVALTTITAMMHAQSLQAIAARGLESGAIDVRIAAIALIAGVFFQYAAARVVTRYGLANGLVVLLGADLFWDVVRSLKSTLDARASAIAIGAGASVVVASWAVLRGAGAPPPAGGGPAHYRASPALRIGAWVPVPSSSVQVYLLATSILMIPATLASFGLGTKVMDALQHDRVFFVAQGVTVLVLAILFTRLFHRTSEMRDLALRLGANAGELDDEMRAARRRALVPTLLLLLTMLLAASAHVAVSAIPLMVAVVVDVAHAVRALRDRDLVAVWSDRRAAAIPPIRAALAHAGIASETRGAAFLTMMQVFAPYAPAEILVEARDRERAEGVVRHLMLGEEAPAAAAGGAAAGDRSPWPVATLVRVLAACAAVALAGSVVAHLPRSAPRDAATPRASFVAVRVDDSVDPFTPSDPDALGVDIERENVPVGATAVETHFAVVRARPNEPSAVARKRLEEALRVRSLPPGARFGFEEMVEYDPEGRAGNVIGWRSVVLAGDPILQTNDIVEAVALEDSGQPGAYHVAITLTDEAGQRFEQATRDWVRRRIALIIDGTINSAPVVRTAIGGGRVSITVGAGEPEQQRKKAEQLARSLSP